MVRWRHGYTGFTLIEMLVATLISAIVLGSIVQALVYTSRRYARSEALAELQHQAHVALRFIAHDIRLAGHWGSVPATTSIAGRAEAGDPNPSGLALPSRCPAAFTTALDSVVEVGTLVSDWGCNLVAAPGNHTLIVRYASAEPKPAQTNRLQLVGDVERATLTTTANSVTTDVGGSIRHLHVMGYYVAEASTLFPDQPVLRRLTLNARNSGPIFVDEEIAPGVERLVVRAHIDTDADGRADERVDAGDSRLKQLDTTGHPVVSILAIDVGIVVRSESGQWHDTGSDPISLIVQHLVPPNDGHLRLAAQRTIAVRNAPWHH